MSYVDEINEQIINKINVLNKNQKTVLDIESIIQKMDTKMNKTSKEDKDKEKIVNYSPEAPNWKTCWFVGGQEKTIPKNVKQWKNQTA